MEGLIATSQDELRGIRLYYVDQSGAKHLLHDHVYHPKPPFPGETPHGVAQERLKEIVSMSGSAMVQRILPGETTSRDVAISAEDLAQIKMRPVQCCFSIIDMKTSRQFEAQSNPEKLSDLAPPPATK